MLYVYCYLCLRSFLSESQKEAELINPLLHLLQCSGVMAAASVALRFYSLRFPAQPYPEVVFTTYKLTNLFSDIQIRIVENNTHDKSKEKVLVQEPKGQL